MDFDTIHSSDEEMESWAEEFIFNRLSPSDLSRYEQHLLTCHKCQKAVEDTEQFIRRLRDASDGPAQ